MRPLKDSHCATHVEEDSAQMGAVALVQNSRGVPHVAVHEVYPEVRMDFLPTLEPLHWGILDTGPLFKRTRGTYWGPLGGGEGITVDSESDAVLHLPACLQQHRRAVRILDALSLTGLIGRPLPHISWQAPVILHNRSSMKQSFFLHTVCRCNYCIFRLQHHQRGPELQYVRRPV